MHTATWQTFMETYIDPAVVMMADREPLFAPPDDVALLYRAEGEMLDLKYRAMLCQRSQVGPMLSMLGEHNYRAMLAEEGFVDAGYITPDG